MKTWDRSRATEGSAFTDGLGVALLLAGKLDSGLTGRNLTHEKEKEMSLDGRKGVGSRGGEKEERNF